MTGSHFGHGQLAKKLAERIRLHFDQKKADGESLVIGLFGEWGSGKTNLLRLIEVSFKPQGKGDVPNVVVVHFNPWRHEKVVHLIVPLLRTTHLAVERYIRENKKNWEKLADKGKGLIKAATKVGQSIGDMTVSLASMFKLTGEIEIPGVGKVGAEVSPKEGFDAAREQRKEPEASNKAASQPTHPDVLYFEFEQTLNTLLSGKDSPRLLFLIDDIDRCLPDKAVEMLESIKLFLDIPGCAFVLAVDDEVVERGILHRYRDYLFQEGETAEGKSLAALPITGIEYLEKIIHLPFRLPLPTQEQVSALLKERCQPLFALHGSEDADIQWDESLLNLFKAHVPYVPRKQLRVAELMHLLLDVAKDSGTPLDRLPLFKLVTLQLFAPELYRLCRRQAGNYRLLQGWAEQESQWGQSGLLEVIRVRHYPQTDKTAKRAQATAKAVDKPNPEHERNRRNFDRQALPLLQALERVFHNRSGFDPASLIQNNPLEKNQLDDIGRYFSFVDQVEYVQERPVAAAQAEGAANPPEQRMAKASQTGRATDTAAPLNLSEFMDMLFGSEPGHWQSAVQREELRGKVLDAATFDQVLKELNGSGKEKRRNSQWVAMLTTVLDEEQFNTIAKDAAKQFQPGKDGDLTDDKAFSEAEFALSLKPGQRALLMRDEAMSDNLIQIVTARDTVEVSRRAEAGRLLGRLGDPRPGVGVKKDGLPDILWEQIPAGRFTMGSPPGQGDDDERPSHEVKIEKAFKISRYPVTNAQYGSFVNAGGYNQEKYWQTQAARDWLKSSDRKEPAYWTDEKWKIGNHPVVGVCWYEALAFCAWLSERTGDTVRLPAEDEWEYVARGVIGLLYAWGGEADPKLGNYRDTRLGRTSAVGLFPPGKAEYGDKRPHELYDMSGNVWEWTASLFQKYDDIWDKNRAKRDNADADGLRVFRGGSWYSYADIVRCAVRIRYRPDFRINYVGFRVVVG